ncbi:MAG TPA: biotin transporter BioY, partial [Oligoflexia bacterium]|nr:biotin transporter BioY [Oligoflexia bacterium]
AVVLMSGLFLGPWKGAVSQALYIGLGALGLPFFAAPAALAGPTGGYILGFVLAAFLTGSLSQKIKDHSGVWNKIKTYGLVLIASLGIFVPGVLWLKLLTGQSWSASLAMGFVPFIIGDLIKTAIAVSSYSVAAAAARAAGRIRKNTVF